VQRFLAFVPSPAGRFVAGVVALALVIGGCGGNEDCSITDSCPNQAPSATITSPTDGASVDEFTAVSFQGSAADPEDGALTGSALVWTSSLDGAIGTGASFSRSDLTAGSHVITLTATDADGRAGTATVDLVVIEVPNDPPAVTITAPADGGSAQSGDNVTFTGTAVDPEDGALTGAALVWTSDLDGVIGTGASIARSDLSGCTHEIVLTATDSRGASGTDTISFTISGAPCPTITAPSDQSSGAPRTELEGTSITFSGSADDVEDGPLTGPSLVWTSNVDGEIGTGESFSRTTLSDGLHTVTLTATDSDGNEGQATVLVIVKPPAAAGYQIHIRWSPGMELTTTQRQAVDDAVDKLESVITGDVLNLVKTEFPEAGTCGGAAIPKMDEAVDDVIIYLEFLPIDGPDGTVASAGPCFVRANTAFSLVGGVRFDTDDLDVAESLGIMDDIIVHEMMHVLGFGIFWDDPVDYLEQPSNSSHPEHDPNNTDTHFTGPEATAQFLAIGGDDYTGGEIVPVENDDGEFGPGSLDGHWRESVLNEEIMSTRADPVTNPLSVLTIGQFDDLGYTVDYGAADPYVQTFSIVFGPQTEQPAVDLSGDVWRGEMFGIDPDGTSRRIR